MRKRILSAPLMLSVLLSPLVQAESAAEKAESSNYLKPDESWISISGRAIEAGPESFMLDYGRGKVFVEMDSHDWYFENSEVLDGDHVTVSGKVDDDTYEATSIEARNVYVEDLGTYFYADAADEEGRDPGLDMRPSTPVTAGDISITGMVSSIDGRRFTMDFGKKQLTVDTSDMDYNPLDDQGYQQLDKGDYVTAVGQIAEGTLKNRLLKAESVITMSNARSTAGQAESR